jgi:signal transduction histidine kinase/FixJ family two-component response regulator
MVLPDKGKALRNSPACLMSMLKYSLYDLIATVPRCVETTTLAVALEIFEEEQCDRLAVLNHQQCLVGLLTCARLVSHFLTAAQNECPHEYNAEELGCSNLESTFKPYLHQSLSALSQDIIQPVHTVPASFSLEQFCLFLRSQKFQGNTNIDWALVDSNGKFVGLVDNLRLLPILAKQKVRVDVGGSHNQQTSKKVLNKSSGGIPEEHGSKVQLKTYRRQEKTANPQVIDKSLVQLLERLPWPLMLQTSTGEILTQNPAWWQQLGALKNPEEVTRQVEAILGSVSSRYSTQQLVQVNQSFRGNEFDGKPEGKRIVGNNVNPLSISALLSATKLDDEESFETAPSSRCFLDSQLGTCICVVQVQSGQERIWQFVKIPLDSSEFKVLNTESQKRQKKHYSTSKPDLWLMLATDVTEQQQLCKELAAKNADLIQLNRLKDEFLACISHELKTPLTAVLGLSRLLVDQQLGELNERQARYAGLIHQSGRHLMSVVNDILDLTRMETGQMELTLSNVKIQEICERAISEAKAIQAQSRKTSQAQASPAVGYQFTLSIEPGLEEIVADELRLRQMLGHLLSNAFKFTETGGEIGLWVSRWEGWVTFTVWDTGIGIPEHQQHLIFQKFQQLENPLTRQYEGTGLGLVLTRALARLHGGDVSFLSREGKGSQFTLLLPPSPPQKIKEGGKGRKGSFHVVEQEGLDFKDRYFPGASSPSQSPRIPASITSSNSQTHRNSLVLVVEAVAQYIEDLTEELTGLGYRVVIARSGCEAVEKARRFQPKAIFVNPLLPLLSGWDVLTLVKSDAATRQIPVIVTATGAEKEQAFAKHADGFLSLPVQHTMLAPLIENLFATPEAKEQRIEQEQTHRSTHTPLRILRLVAPELEYHNLHPLLQEHRVIEVDNIDQAELLSRVWHFDVVLLDTEMPVAQTYLQQLSHYPGLAALPLVTCNVPVTQAASQVPGLSVFPCLTQNGAESNTCDQRTDALLSVLQIASGMCCPHSILVLDLSSLPDLPYTNNRQLKSLPPEKNSSNSTNMPVPCSYSLSRGSEWLQALIQYLQTAGFKAIIGRSWAELLQNIRHQSVDLLLICLGESIIPAQVYPALKALGQLPFDLPPILVLDQRLSRNERESEQVDSFPEETQSESIEAAIAKFATQILPRSISMEELLNHINQALAKS